MITRLIVLLVLLLSWPMVVQAQLRPGAFSTVRTMDTSAGSLGVGCAVGAATTTCVGGISAGIQTIYRDETTTDEGNAAFHVRGFTDNNKILVVGYNTTTDFGFIQSNHLTSGYTSLYLQPNGGNVGIGNTGILICTNCVTAMDLATTTVTAGSYGSSTAISTFTVDANGRLTAAANVTPQLTLTSTYFSSLSGTAITGIPQLASANVWTNTNSYSATSTFTGAITSSNTNTYTTAPIALTCDGATVNQNINVGSVTGVRFTTSGATGACILGGVTGGADGRMLLLLNATGQAVQASFEDAGSTAANRIATPGAGAFSIEAGAFGIMVYDGTANRWRAVRGVV